MILRQPNWLVYAVLLLLVGMSLMTASRFVMNSSRFLYVVLLTSSGICAIGAAFCMFRHK